MSWNCNSSYCHLEALNSLVTRSVHVLCSPVNTLYSKVTNLSLSSLYDLNLFTNCNQNVSAKAPRRFLELLYDKFHDDPTAKEMFEVNSRQALLDYILRERIVVRANFIIQLLKDGGFYDFDLWQLCEINDFTTQEMELILTHMCSVSHVFKRLSIGGALWMYNFRVTNGFLKKFLCKSGSLINLKSLKIQQISFEIDFISLLYSCPNLEKLEISQPSLSNNDMRKMSMHLSSVSLSICQSLRYINFPSSVKEEGIMYFLAHFPNIVHIRCTPFEQLIDLIELSSTTLSLNQYFAQRSLAVLGNVRSLSITHPMSCDTVDRLLMLCPKLEQLSLHIQDGMNLLKLTTHAPHLVKLDLHNSPSAPVEFNECIAPVLEVLGKQLKSLSLEYFNHIDLTKCAYFCPNLEAFSSQWFSTLAIQNHLRRWLNIKKPFSQLKHLRLRPSPLHSLHVDTCNFMLNDATLLKHIELYCCSEISDDTIFEISAKNPLRHLQSFIMRHGHCVTNDALLKLVSCASSTGSLVFHDCGLVPPNIKSKQ